MPRLLAVGHVTWDRRPEGDVLGGAVTYASLAARKLGWEAAVLTAAGPDFEPARDLPAVSVFCSASRATTRFRNEYDDEGVRHQQVTARASDVDLAILPDAWRDPDVLFLGPVAGEVSGRTALGFTAEVVGAAAQGWLRKVDGRGNVTVREWSDPGAELSGVHALFLSEEDLPGAALRLPELLRAVPIVALTRGWRGLLLATRERTQEVIGLPRPEVDPTGAGDVFASAFLVRYQETGDPDEAAVFGACAASGAVEGIGASALGDRAEVLRRMALREERLDGGDWDD